MLERFADTSGWAALADQAEQFHLLARSRFEEVWVQGGRLVTTSYVLTELTALLTRLRFDKVRQAQFLSDLRTDPSVSVVFIDQALDAAAWQLWGSRLDKHWTLVDCASFVVMTQRGLTEAISSDHHFEQAGYLRLLK